MRYITLIFIFFLGLNSFGQNRNIDSLKLALKNAKHDSIVCDILSYLIKNAPEGEWQKYNLDLKRISETNLNSLHSERNLHQYNYYKKFLGFAFDNLGFDYKAKGEIKLALENHYSGLKIFEELGNKESMAATLNNIATIYIFQGNVPKALEYYNRGLKIQEEIGIKEGIAASLNNIGHIYIDHGDVAQGLQFYDRSLKIQEEIGNKIGIATSLNNLGSIFRSQQNIPKALDYFVKSLKTLEEIDNKELIASVLINIGFTYRTQGDPEVTSSKDASLKSGLFKALEYYGRSLKINEELQNKLGITLSLNHIGAVYIKLAEIEKSPSLNKKYYSEALINCKKSFDLSNELGYPSNIKAAAEKLSIIYKAQGNHKLALESYELFIQMRDSINNETNRKASIKSQLKYEYEKQAAADSVAHAKESEIKNAEIAKQTAEIKAKKNQQYALFGGLGLVMVFAGFMYNRFKVTQKQKGIIEEQKEVVEEQKKLVEEKQKEILDSIQYARRIQMAQIPSEKRVNVLLKKLRNHEGK